MSLEQIKNRRKISRSGSNQAIVITAALKALQLRQHHRDEGLEDPGSHYTPGQAKTPITPTNSASASKDAPEDCEFAIAADLTLYANPLRILKKTAKPPAHSEASASGSEMIAADLVKYGSPLDDKP